MVSSMCKTMKWELATGIVYPKDFFPSLPISKIICFIACRILCRSESNWLLETKDTDVSNFGKSRFWESCGFLVRKRSFCRNEAILLLFSYF